MAYSRVAPMHSLSPTTSRKWMFRACVGLFFLNTSMLREHLSLSLVPRLVPSSQPWYLRLSTLSLRFIPVLVVLQEPIFLYIINDYYIIVCDTRWSPTAVDYWMYNIVHMYTVLWYVECAVYVIE